MDRGFEQNIQTSIEEPKCRQYIQNNIITENFIQLETNEFTKIFKLKEYDYHTRLKISGKKRTSECHSVFKELEFSVH